MNKRTKALSISPSVKGHVLDRDKGCCILCGAPGLPNAHYVSRSQGGLGIERNIVTLCRECHRCYDQTVERDEIGKEIKAYLMGCYSNWDESMLIYRKYGGT